MLLLQVAAVVLIGWALVPQLHASEDCTRGIILRATISFGIGVGLLSVLAFVWLWFYGPLTQSFSVISLIAAALVFCVARTFRGAPAIHSDAQTESSGRWDLFVLFAVLIVVFLIVRGQYLQTPHG